MEMGSAMFLDWSCSVDFGLDSRGSRSVILRVVLKVGSGWGQQS